MKLKTNRRTASVIIFAGAVLVGGCSELPPAASPAVTGTLLYQRDTAAATEEMPAPGSSARLGRTEYTIALPEGYVLSTANDTVFRVQPASPDTGCGQLLTFTFWEKALKVPGTRPVRRIPATILNTPVEFVEFGRPDVYCKYRTGGVTTDPLYHLQILCTAPPGERMEQLFAIALSLRKSPASGN